MRNLPHADSILDDPEFRQNMNSAYSQVKSAIKIGAVPGVSPFGGSSQLAPTLLFVTLGLTTLTILPQGAIGLMIVVIPTQVNSFFK
jgi:hypothetical protein